MIVRRTALAGLLLLAAACARLPAPPPADPAFAALAVRGIAVGPVDYATRQPDGFCSLFIDEELRSAVARELRRRGYAVQSVGASVPRSFAAGTPPPSPGDLPAAVAQTPADADALLLVWIDEYWDNTLCGWEGPKYLTMGAAGVLYAGSPPREVWRGLARIEARRDCCADELIWLTTSQLADRMLATLPAGPEWSAPR